jgi:predicted dienelactone hydrolase
MGRSTVLHLAAVLLVGWFCCAATSAHAASKDPSPSGFHVGMRIIDFERPDGLKVSVGVWYPTLAPTSPHVYCGATKGDVALDAKPYSAAGPFPLLVFSHGYGGCGYAQVFLAEALAARGWIVAAPDHHDKDFIARLRTGRNPDFNGRLLLKHGKEISSSSPADRDKYLYRLDEMRLALDGMLSSRTFGKLIDRDKIAVGGHSFGSFTALGLCGTIKDRQFPGIKAVLLFSPGAAGYLYTKDELSRVKIPSMYLWGQREESQKRGNWTMKQIADKVYGAFHSTKYLLEIKGANHFSFNNNVSDRLLARILPFSGTPAQFDVICRYSVAFLEKYVAGRSDDGVLEHSDPMLLRYLKDGVPV